jgi:hypothetical protein
MPPENSSQPNNLPAAYNRTRIFIAIAALIVVGLGGIMLITSDKNPLPHSNSARIKRATAKQAALYKEKEGVPLSELKQNCLQDVSARKATALRNYSGNLPANMAKDFDTQFKKCQSDYS